MAKPPTTFQKLVAIGQLLLSVVFIILATYSLIMAVLAYLNLEATHVAMKDFVSNWETQPIVDLTVEEHACPSGYEDLITRNWPGTVAGCDCLSSPQYDFRVYQGFCSDNQTQAQCFDVFPQSPIRLSWFHGYILCGKRSGATFEHAVRPNADHLCPEGYFPSHGGDINNIICIPNGDSVPINDIVLVNPGSSVPAGYDYYDLLEGYRLAFTTNADSLPIIRFRLTEENVCADSRQYTATEGRNLHILIDTSQYDSCSQKVGGFLFDPRYESIGFIRELELFEDNRVVDSIAQIPGYDLDSMLRYFWDLFESPFFTWHLECEHGEEGYTRAYMIELINDAVEVGSQQLRLMLTCILDSLVNSLVISGIGIYIAYRTLKDYEFKEDNAKRLKYFNIASKIAKWTFFILKLVFYILVIRVIDRYSDSIELMNKAQCSDEIANNFMDFYATTLLDARQKNRNGLISLIFSICIEAITMLVSLVMWGVKKCKGGDSGQEGGYAGIQRR